MLSKQRKQHSQLRITVNEQCSILLLRLKVSRKTGNRKVKNRERKWKRSSSKSNAVLVHIDNIKIFLL